MTDASPEDWPRGGGGALCRDLDDTVRCPICGELFETPLSLRCGHAFCSGCVRSSIEFQERSGPATCPQCRDRCDTADLRPAPQLRAVAAAFLAARPLLLASVTAAITAADGPPEACTAEDQEQRQQLLLRRRQPPRQAAPRQAEQRQQQQEQQRSRPKLRPRRQPHDAASQQQQHHHRQHDGIISVELSSGSEDDTPAAQPKVAVRRQQPKRGRAASAGLADDADASQSSGSAKRRQLSSPSTAGDEPRQAAGSSAAAAVAADGRRASRSAGRAAAPVPAMADGRSGSRGGPGRTSDGSPAGTDSTADEDEGEQLVSASDSDPEYLGEERVPPSSSGDDAAAVPPPQPAPAREKLPAGHVRCPNCATMLPAAFINSHLDSCLSAGGAKAGKASGFGSKGSSGGSGTGAAGLSNGRQSGGGGSAGGGSRAAGNPAIAVGVTGSGGSIQGGGAGGRQAAGSRPAAGSGSGGLKVPPKLCVALMSDKAMRDTCKKFGLPTTGRKEVLAERYSRFRLEVQTANDSGESAIYADIARRVLQRESRTAKAAFGMPLARSTANSSPTGVGDSSFQELIKATRQRQAAQRAASGPATSGGSSKEAVVDAARSGIAAGGAAAAAAGHHSTPVPDAAQTEPPAVSGAADERGPAAAPADGHAHASQGTSQQLPVPVTAASAPAATAASALAAAAEPNSLSTIAGLAAAGNNAASAGAAGIAGPPPALQLLDEQSRSASRGLPDGDAKTVGGAVTLAGQHQKSHAAAGNSGAGSGGAADGVQLNGSRQDAAAGSQPQQNMLLGRPGPTLQQPEQPEPLDTGDGAAVSAWDAQAQPQQQLQGQPHGWSQQREAEQVGVAPFEGTGFGGFGGAASGDDAALQGISCTQRPPPLAPALSCGQQLLLQPFTFEGAFSDDSRSCPLSPSV